MTGKNKIDGRITRKFEFIEDKIVVHESFIKPKRCTFIGHMGKFRAIHMASSGYYFPQVEIATEKSKLVEFKFNDDT